MLFRSASWDPGRTRANVADVDPNEMTFTEAEVTDPPTGRGPTGHIPVGAVSPDME